MTSYIKYNILRVEACQLEAVIGFYTKLFGMKYKLVKERHTLTYPHDKSTGLCFFTADKF
jgi:hypothetical protein